MVSLLSCSAPPINQEIKDERIANLLLNYNKLKKVNFVYKNNNPFNIRNNHLNNWQGKINTNYAFEQFSSLDYGIRAGIKLLLNYHSKYELTTIEQIIHRFAPPFENDTENYIQWVSKQTGIPRNKPIDLSYKDTLINLCKYMIQMETGKPIAHNKIEQVYSKYFT